MSSPLFDVPPPEPVPSRWQRPGWPTVAAALVVGLLLGFLFAPREVETITVPASTEPVLRPAPTSSTSSPTTAAEVEESADIAVAEGQGVIRVRVENATLDNHGLYVVRVKVENIGGAPFETFYLDAELADDRGHRFNKEPGTLDDLPEGGAVNPKASGVVTFRFRLPGEAQPTTLFVSEQPDGGEPAPLKVP